MDSHIHPEVGVSLLSRRSIPRLYMILVLKATPQGLMGPVGLLEGVLTGTGHGYITVPVETPS